MGANTILIPNLPLFLLAFLSLNHLRTGFCVPAADNFKFQAGTPVSAEVKLARGSLSGKLGTSLSQDAISSSCKSQNGGDCWEWSSEKQQLSIQNEPTATGSDQCKTVVWLSQDVNTPPVDCWSLTDGSKWYGGGSAENQKWPIARDSIDEQPQITGGVGDNGDINNINNRLWFSSAGVAIKVEDNVPLFVTVEKGQRLCFKAENKSPYLLDKTMPAILSYSICYGDDLAELHRTIMSVFFELPKSTPEFLVFRNPIWHTFPKYPTIPSMLQLEDYVTKIESFGSMGSILMLGHGWTPCLGEHKLHTTTFPEPAAFVKFIADKGMHLGLWVHPHMSPKCDAYQEGDVRDYFIQSSKPEGGPATTQWAGDLIATVDFTNPDSVKWYAKSLQDLKDKYGVQSFFFDRGQAALLPKDSRPLNGPVGLQPDIFSTKYVEMAASISNMSMVNVGRNSQKYPVLVRMPPKKDYSGKNDSIQSVIPSMLQMGINGFPFLLPDVVGGSRFEGDKPDKNLYIRWLQLSALMPVLHFSVGPWEYDDQVVKIAKGLLDTRTQLFDEHIKPAIEDALKYGSPTVRPMWWLAPYDPRAYVLDDQFLVGNSLLVAPIVDGSEVRDIYFPPGQWISSLRQGEIIRGPAVLPNVRIPLDTLAYFTASTA